MKANKSMSFLSPHSPEFTWTSPSLGWAFAPARRLDNSANVKNWSFMWDSFSLTRCGIIMRRTVVYRRRQLVGGCEWDWTFNTVVYCTFILVLNGIAFVRIELNFIGALIVLCDWRMFSAIRVLRDWRLNTFRPPWLKAIALRQTKTKRDKKKKCRWTLRVYINQRCYPNLIVLICAVPVHVPTGARAHYSHWYEAHFLCITT